MYSPISSSFQLESACAFHAIIFRSNKKWNLPPPHRLSERSLAEDILTRIPWRRLKKKIFQTNNMAFFHHKPTYKGDIPLTLTTHLNITADWSTMQGACQTAGDPDHCTLC